MKGSSIPDGVVMDDGEMIITEVAIIALAEDLARTLGCTPEHAVVDAIRDHAPNLGIRSADTI